MTTTNETTTSQSPNERGVRCEKAIRNRSTNQVWLGRNPLMSGAFGVRSRGTTTDGGSSLLSQSPNERGVRCERSARAQGNLMKYVAIP